ncbi:MAG: hypothetical protein AAGF23_19840 [Acidobacteriota bacterium]
MSEWADYARRYASAPDQEKAPMWAALTPEQQAAFEIAWTQLGPGLIAATSGMPAPAAKPSNPKGCIAVTAVFALCGLALVAGVVFIGTTGPGPEAGQKKLEAEAFSACQAEAAKRADLDRAEFADSREAETDHYDFNAIDGRSYLWLSIGWHAQGGYYCEAQFRDNAWTDPVIVDFTAVTRREAEIAAEEVRRAGPMFFRDRVANRTKEQK